MELDGMLDHILTGGGIETIGALAGMLTTSAFAPQVFRSLRTKSVEDISLVMYWMLCSGIVLWIVYGVFIGSWPLVVANLVTFTLAASVLFLRIFHAPRRRP